MLHIVGRNGGRKLKKIWQEQNVPPWRRDTTPLLFYGDTLIAAAGGSSLKRGGLKRVLILNGSVTGSLAARWLSGFAHHDGADFRMAETGNFVEA